MFPQRPGIQNPILLDKTSEHYQNLLMLQFFVYIIFYIRFGMINYLKNLKFDTVLIHEKTIFKLLCVLSTFDQPGIIVVNKVP